MLMGISLDDKRRMISEAAEKQMGGKKSKEGMGPMGCYVRDLYDDYAIIDHGGKLHQVSYTINPKGTVSLSDPKEVVARTVYEPVKQARKSLAEATKMAKEEKAEGEAA